VLFGVKILLVEDDEALRSSFARFLEHSGYAVTQAGNGDMGQFMTMLSDYDLIISDVNMPEVDGIAMTKFIKSRGNTPILLMTGLAGEEVINKARDAHADMFITKPFESSQLLKCVEQLLSKKT
jgi:DNA-binding response OmpR family regulator